MVDIIDNRGRSNEEFIKNIRDRSQLNLLEQQTVVNDIIINVRNNKDKALFEYTAKFDHVQLNSNSIKVTEAEIQEAYNQIDDGLISIIQKAKRRIVMYHEKQKRNSWIDMNNEGEMLGQKITPIEKVGVYVPGGKAVYPSSVLMNILPATVAGVGNIIMVTPPQPDGSINPGILVAAQEAGVTEIYKVGGAQAIAALAFGTESISKVDKIVGPGNIYVALAKRAVYGYVNIDSIAGPSEILVIADKTAKATYVAADLLSQAEHDELASSILITDSETFALEVKKELELQTSQLSRKAIIEQSLKSYGAIVIVDRIEQAIDLSNEIAPEHLEICTVDPFGVLPSIKNAGAIFLGNYSPEPLGDYMAGPNHVLPTSGTAKFFSPLGVDDFIKKSSIISFSKEALEVLHEDIITFAEAEELTAHANAIKVRFGDSK